ncbi:MAG TPA: hypothetical protein VF173_24305 [Thermoanaerobaculia bacterium]|nr:hypothetical protein [Thermoanaerobaculia bacterium]
MSKARFAVWLFALALVAAPALALDSTIYNGIDLWTTRGDGSTFADFAAHPIPAGFFCAKSAAFTGRIPMQGVPLATSVPGVLGRTDTIVQRLDDAVFNRKGVASTRLQVRALNFVSIAPVQTACGAFNASLMLDGEQPITRMQIVRENAQGGHFSAPISVNVKISFTPVGRAVTESLEIRKMVRFPPLPNQRWSSLPAQSYPQLKGFVLVDTDGDHVPDTYLPGISNFGVGQLRPRAQLTEKAADCHESDCGAHCVQ